MKIAHTVVLSVLVFLAISSGITKILLIQQDVDFFGKYGFSTPILIAYGATQLIGGILLIFRKTRFIGAVIVVFTFLVSFVMLMLEGNIPVSLATVVATALLVLVMKRSWEPAEDTSLVD